MKRQKGKFKAKFEENDELISLAMKSDEKGLYLSELNNLSLPQRNKRT